MSVLPTNTQARLEARADEAEELAGALADLRDEFEPGSDQWKAMSVAAGRAEQIQASVQALHDELRIA